MKRGHPNVKSELYKTENTASNKSKVLKPPTPDKNIHRSKERQPSEKTHSNQHFLKSATVNKQQNNFPDITGALNGISSSDSAEVEFPVKTVHSRKQRSRSTVSDRRPWGQLLNKHSNIENESVFGKFDPLRTLHFLARELQAHMQARLPEETNLQEIIKAMHSALKRIPPEVASTVQLQQQSLDLLPRAKKSSSKDSFEIDTCDKLESKAVQTPKESPTKEFGEIQKLIEGNTMKLEASCRHLENICGQLRDEKVSLEAVLQTERANSKLLQMRIEEVENANRQLLQNLSRKDEELLHFKSAVGILELKLQEKTSSNSEVYSTVGELKKCKLSLEQDILKLEHQLRLCAIEKEKYLAILAVRDKQIFEIRSEMAQLQQSVNEQLVELHNFALGTVPGNIAGQEDKDKKNDGVSSVWANEEESRKNSDYSLKDFDSDDEKEQLPTHDIFQGIL